MAGLQTPDDAEATQLIAEAWHSQYRIGDAHRQAEGLSARLGTHDPQLLRNARIVEAFWQCRYGRPSAGLVGELAQAQQQARAAGDVRFEVIASLALAQWHSQNQQHQEALAQAQAAFALCAEQGPEDRFERVVALNGLGVYHSYLLNWSEALDCLYQGLHWAAELPEPGLEATLHANLGTIFFSTGNVLDAWAAFDRAASLRPRHLLDRIGCNIALNKAHTLCRLGRWDAALDSALPLMADAVRTARTDPYTFAFAARAAAALGRVDEALAWAQQGAAIAENDRANEGIAVARIALGHAHLAAGGHQAAWAAFTAAKDVLGTQGEVFYQLEAEEGLAAAARGLGDHAAAIAALDSSITLREAIASLATRTQVAATRIRGRLDELKQERNRARQAQAAAEEALQALRAAQAELLQMQQRAMASKLMASLAHQLNTPLGTCITAHSSQHDGLRGLAQQMQSNALRRNDLQDALHRSLGNAELMGTNLARLERLMKRFALFGAEHFLTQERLPCLMSDAVHQAAGRFGLAHSQCFELSVPAVTLRCDAAALHGLLAELLDNALAARRPSDPAIAVSAVCDGARVTLQIADRGPGMSAAHMKRALNPYNTPNARLDADASAAGLGLGLGWPIVNHLAQHVLGAEIGLHASPDSGTCVRLQLPLKPD